MTDSRVPGWIKQIKEQKERDATREEYEAQQAVQAAQTIQVEGPLFWKQLLKELEITVNSLPEIGVRATMSYLSSQTEEGCQISVARESQFPRIAYVNVFYAPGSDFIRCNPSEGRAFQLQFYMPDSQKILVRTADNTRTLFPGEAAQHIIQPLVERMEFSSPQ